MAAQVGGDHAVVLAEIGDLVVSLLGIAASAMDAHNRAARWRFGGPNVDHTQTNRPGASDSDGCAGKIHTCSNDRKLISQSLIAPAASEANCRRHITISTAIVVSAKTSGPRNQPR